MDDLTKILNDQSKKLSPTIKKAIESDGWVNTLKTTAWKYGLSKEAAEAVDTETVLVLYGLEAAFDFKQNLVAQNIGIPTETIGKIANEVHSTIFAPIKNELEKFVAEEDKNAAQKAAPSQLPGQNVESGLGFVKSAGGNREENYAGLQKESLLQGIEHPQKFPAVYEKPSPPSVSSSPNIADNKLNAVVKLPREEVQHDASYTPPTPGQTSPATPETPPSGGYGGQDPYRETIE